MKRIERGGEVRKSTWPSLTERLYNIGHDSPSPPKSLSVTAASYYLGSATDKCVAIIDKRSLSKLRSEVIRDVGSEDR